MVLQDRPTGSDQLVVQVEVFGDHPLRAEPDQRLMPAQPPVQAGCLCQAGGRGFDAVAQEARGHHRLERQPRGPGKPDEQARYAVPVFTVMLSVYLLGFLTVTARRSAATVRVLSGRRLRWWRRRALGGGRVRVSAAAGVGR